MSPTDARKFANVFKFVEAKDYIVTSGTVPLRKLFYIEKITIFV